MIRYYILAKGRVQGVGFRFFVQMNSTFLGLTGYVRNLNDASVEIEVQGTYDSINNLIELINKGNRFIKIDTLEVKEITIVSSEKKFIIR
ncbi:acylphosphatase [Clostridium sp.]|uniref:acylphosphatase n=1 Tax=Clostridium sp. TaxID=1506 RepID=UPI0026382CC7|nr:acylphosphatase [Clostridium sp.]